MTWFQSALLVLLIIVIFCGASGWIGAWLDREFGYTDEHETDYENRV